MPTRGPRRLLELRAAEAILTNEVRRHGDLPPLSWLVSSTTMISGHS